MANNQKYYDLGKVAVGLLIFIVIFAFPLLYNRLKAAPAPEPQLTEKAKTAKMCVLPTAEMKTEHMQLLDDWRDTVVREAKRIYVAQDGRQFNMSLTNTCLDCHSNKANFCDKCHNYVAADPYCWDCHIIPEEMKK